MSGSNFQFLTEFFQLRLSNFWQVVAGVNPSGVPTPLNCDVNGNLIVVLSGGGITSNAQFLSYINAFTGGAGNDLDSLATAAGQWDGVLVSFQLAGGGLLNYRCIAGTGATNLPAVVRPQDFNSTTNPRVWTQVS